MSQFKDLVDRRRLLTDLVGRKQELDVLLEILKPGGPLVVHVNGIAGIGKSTLLDVFAQQARATGATVIRLDCGTVEPTEAGLLAELAVATGGSPGSLQEVAVRLGQVGARVIVALDTYEVFRLMDSWLRQNFVPFLPDNVRVILCGREEPVTAWLLAPGWQGLFKTLRLGSLDQQSALEFLSQAGIPSAEARQLEGICHGHPLALTLAAALKASDATNAMSAGVGQRVVEELSRLYVADIPPQTRRIVEAASVLRRVTVPLVAALLTDLSPQDAYERIRALPFVQTDRDGLRLHDTVREVIAATLRAENPQKYREYRRAGYRQIMSELRTAVPSGLWRCTADLLYVLENPVVREAFFPCGGQEYVVEQAQARDVEQILEIVDRHETSQMAAALGQWLTRAPETFAVARDPRGTVAGFYCAFDPSRWPVGFQREDPVSRTWLEHLDRQPLPRTQGALFLRRWLAAETGEAPSAVQAACFLDLKRKYLELRPNLRRVYLVLQDLAPYAAVFRTLEFQVLSGSSWPNSAHGYSTAMLDFGPSSVDGWLARLVAAELGVEDQGILDCAARELVLKDGRVSLSKLEFGVIEYLQRHAGQAVSRTALLENVWGQSYDGGSNVVDVVIRALRKKLADRAFLVETVQGVGYRWRRESSAPAA